VWGALKISITRPPAEMRKLLNRKIVEQYRKCAICLEEFTKDTFSKNNSGTDKKK
jgi:hypothetical protein